MESGRSCTFSCFAHLEVSSGLTALQHTYVTGGSTGLGLSLAVLLTKKGAHVSIVARNQDRLDKALEQLEVRSYAYITLCSTQYFWLRRLVNALTRF